MGQRPRIELDAPAPIETRAITEDMPITIPRMVSPERALLADNAINVSSNISVIFILIYYFFDQKQSRRL